MGKILVPVVSTVNDERVASLYSVDANYDESKVNGIRINNIVNDIPKEEYKSYNACFKNIYREQTSIHIDVGIYKFVDEDYLEKPTESKKSSITLGIFLAAEVNIYGKKFNQKFDYVVATGNIENNQLELVDEVKEKFEALKCVAEKDEDKSFAFIYVEDENNEIIKGLSIPNNIELIPLKEKDSVAGIRKQLFDFRHVYYERLEKTNGLYSGISEIKENELYQRAFTYCFSYDEEKLVKIELLDGLKRQVSMNAVFTSFELQNEIDEKDGKTASIDIQYFNEDTIKCIYRDIEGKLLYIEEKYRDNNNFNTVSIINPISVTGHVETIDVTYGKNTINGKIYERDSKGFIVKEFFTKYKRDDTPQADRNRVFGYEYERISKYIVNKYYLNLEGKRKRVINGTAGVKYIYDDNTGLLMEKMFIDESGNGISNTNFISKVLYSYDEYHNIISETFYSIDEKKRCCSYGYHRKKLIYKDGILKKVELFDIHKVRTPHLEYGYSGISYENDNTKMVETFLGNDDLETRDEFALCKKISKTFINGYLIQKTKHNIENNVSIEDYTYSNEGALEIIETDSHIKTLNKNGQVIKFKFKDLTYDDFNIIKYGYNERGDITKTDYFNNNRPAKLKFGYSSIKYEYDYRLKEFSHIFLDDIGNPADSNNGWCYRKVQIRQNGFQSKYITTFRNKNKELCLSQDKEPPVEILLQNAEGQDQEVVFSLDEAGKIIIEKQLFSYDSFGNITKYMEYKNEKENLTFTGGFIHKYDETTGLLKESISINENSQPSNDNFGIAIRRFAYKQDEERTFQFDENDVSIFSIFGLAGYLLIYDKANRLTERYCINEVGEKIQCNNNLFYAIKFRYLSASKLERIIEDKNGKCLAKDKFYYQTLFDKFENTRTIRIIKEDGSYEEIDKRPI